MRILVTAIGSMSAQCVISTLKEQKHYVVGCDIYPREWHFETRLCDAFYQSPLAKTGEPYIRFLLDVCQKERIEYIFPLTDAEIDILNLYRSKLEQQPFVVCMPKKEVLEIVRNKYKLYKRFELDTNVPSIKTCLLNEIDSTMSFPCLAKPVDGRSSEGLLRNATRSQVDAIDNKDNYIIQEQLKGDLYTVDVCRNSISKKCVALPRKELLRTKNGAGIAIQMVEDEQLIKLTKHIAKELKINGCVNMEFICNDGKYFLIDINPRFSAGVAYSVISGYNMVENHLKCFIGEDIDNQTHIKEQIIIKKYDEVITC